MKRLLLLITICISSVSFGQVVFDETYFPNNLSSSSIEGKDIVEFNGRYLISSKEGLTSFDYNSGLNASLEYQSINNSTISTPRLVKNGQSDLFICQNIYPEIQVKKLDQNFNVIWNCNTSAISVLDSASYNVKTISPSHDGGCIIGLEENKFDNNFQTYFYGHSVTFIKVSASGQEEWRKKISVDNQYLFDTGINGISSFGESGIDKIIQTFDGNYFGVGGRDTLLCGGESIWFFKFDNNGDILWETYIHPEYIPGGSHGKLCKARDVIEVQSGDFNIVGYRHIGSSGNAYVGVTSGDGRPWIAMLNANGNIVSDTLYSTMSRGSFHNILESNSNTYLTFTYENLFGNGNTVFTKLNNDLTLTSLDTAYISNDDSYTRSMITGSDGAIVFTGSYDDSLWIFKYNPGQSNISELNSNQPKELIKIVNLLGQEVEYTPNTVLIYQYSDGTSEKVFTIED